MPEKTNERSIFLKKITEIQKNLKVPKNHHNKFGDFYYRNCEDILNAVKPRLGDLTLTLSDRIVEVGGRLYVEATATIADDLTDQHITATAYAREAESKKGMDEAQLTGSCSSYARKYALNGLFLIDDTKDADTLTGANEAPKYLNQKQLTEIKSLIEKSGADESLFLTFVESESLNTISADKYLDAKTALEKKIGKQSN